MFLFFFKLCRYCLNKINTSCQLFGATRYLPWYSLSFAMKFRICSCLLAPWIPVSLKHVLLFSSWSIKYVLPTRLRPVTATKLDLSRLNIRANCFFLCYSTNYHHFVYSLCKYKYNLEKTTLKPRIFPNNKNIIWKNQYTINRFLHI